MERFPGYTLSSLLAEDTELMRLIAIERLGTPETPMEEGARGG